MSESPEHIQVDIEQRVTLPDEETNRQQAAKVLSEEVDMWRSYNGGTDDRAEVKATYETDDGQISLVSHAAGSLTLIHVTDISTDRYLFDKTQSNIEHTKTVPGQEEPQVTRSTQVSGYLTVLTALFNINRAQIDSKPIDKNL